MPLDRLWVRITAEELDIERQQSIDEGTQFRLLQSEYECLRDDLQEDPYEHQDAARAFFDRCGDLPDRDGYEFDEPSDLEGIRRTRPDRTQSYDIDLSTEQLSDRILGAWEGRAAGCLLGKPFETWNREKILGFLQAIDADPLREYVRSDVPESVASEYELDEIGDYQRAFVDEIDHIARDDDLDYTIVGLGILENHGLSFESTDVAGYWLSNIPAYNTFTAERVAYRNFLTLVEPPESASHRNPYREGIGALIRGDAFGYVSPGNPAQAAELAWRDGRISHVKNGIYGEMFVAAMVAGAPTLTDRTELLRVGLSQIPAPSRLAAAVEDVIRWYENGVSYEEAVDRLHERWDESNFYDWLHVITNAQVIAIGLLWGEGAFGQSIARTVQAGFDTDSTGATVGSILGMMVGSEAIADRWTAPLNDTIETALVDHPRERFSELAKRTRELSSERNDR